MSDESPAYWAAAAESFDDAADHGLRDPAVREAWRQLLIRALPAPKARIADLGCGTGAVALLLAEIGHEADGLDFSDGMLERARAKSAGRAGVRFHLGDAADPQLPRESFDAVIVRHVLWALPDRTAALRNWLELLRPDGRLVLIEGLWHTGAGIAAVAVLAILDELGREAELTTLSDPAFWGGEIADERYMIVSG